MTPEIQARTAGVKSLTVKVRVEWVDGVGVNVARHTLQEEALKARLNTVLGEFLDGPKAAQGVNRDIAAVSVRIDVE